MGEAASLALIDANQFYVACERVFDPKLTGVPVVVLSNNDGCIIARSEEVQALGIGMSEPIFKVRPLIARHHIRTFSSNYALYGDMSRRVNDVLNRFSPEAEVYSIDETFLGLAGLGIGDPWIWGQDLRATVKRWTGIPTCVGLGPSKTLAKLANKIAKKNPVFSGVCDLSDLVVRTAVLRACPVGQVWGIGPALARKLAGIGVTTAGELCDLDARLARQLGTVVLERIVRELQGVSCLALELIPPTRKGLAVTRSFGRPVPDLDGVLEAVAMYATRAGEKLRAHGLVAGQLAAFLHTSPHKEGPQHYGGCTARLLPMSADTRDLVAAAQRCLRAAWREGFAYVKAGVILDDLRRREDVPPCLFAEPRAGSEALMAAMDRINARHGRHTIFPAAMGVARPWRQRTAHRSPRYTTCLKELPQVRA
jgi:DNA polymerase V